LKQPCVQLLQATAAVGQTPRARTDLVQELSHLLATLRSIKPNSVDARLAEYVFVPISQVLRISRQVPVHGLELCLQCISILLRTRWGGGLEPALSGQLLILFTFLAKPSSAENGIAATSEELQALAFQCMAELMMENGHTQQSRQAITATANVPALGEAVLVMLDSLTGSPSHSVKIQAIGALDALNNAMSDDDALASFLPRIVSSLTTLLTPSSSSRPNFRVVEKCLDVLASILLRLLRDEHTKNLPEKLPSTQLSQGATVARSMSWLHATSSQIKIALVNIFKLREHDKSEVREALLRLCLCVVQDCRKSLSDCTSMTIETMVSLVDYEVSQDRVESKLQNLLATDTKLSDVLRESLHGWIVSLPRLMQSKDDHRRRRMVQQVSVTLRLFDQAPMCLDKSLADSLRDGISSVLSDSKGLEVLGDQSSSVTDRPLMLSSTQYSDFLPLKLRFKGQDDMMKEFRLLIQELARSDAALTMAQELLITIDAGSQERRLASFWIALSVVTDVTTKTPSVDDFMDLGAPNLREEVLDNLYSHSLSILQQPTGKETPWQFYGLALEAVALQARRYRSDYRAELSEVLYPILGYLGNSHSALRNHAMTCLNIVSESSGYACAGELVVENVDYVVNAVGLKLAIGDVSPQAPQVLLMMMRLCGPSLLPYLDDLVGSIFDALERYHGYPKLAELLFSVLKGMAEEGVKAPQLAVIMKSEQQQSQHQKTDITMAFAIEKLKQLKAISHYHAAEEAQPEHVPFPEKPWKEDSSQNLIDANDLLDDDPAEPCPPVDDLPPPAPRTYTTLLKISSLTQHYLTTPSPSLRSSLLSLLQTTIPALAQHENSFLPLIHTLWPVLLPRLEDPEAYIVSNALGVVGLMCELAGGFMRSRIDDAWDILRRVYKRTQGTSETRKYAGDTRGLVLDISAVVQDEKGLSVKSRSSYPTTTAFSETSMQELYVDTPTRMIWSSLIGLLCRIARHVPIKQERGDAMLDMLDTVLERIDVKTAMECWNADAVWLRLYRKRVQMYEGENGDCAHAKVAGLVGKMPVGRPEWCFVKG